MPKIAAGGGSSEEIVRVTIEPQTLNEKNPDGTYKFTDEQINDWLNKLRGEREVSIAKAATRTSQGPAAPAKPKFSAEDMSDE